MRFRFPLQPQRGAQNLAPGVSRGVAAWSEHKAAERRQNRRGATEFLSPLRGCGEDQDRRPPAHAGGYDLPPLRGWEVK
jgi:hypothetical protein